MPGTAVTSHIRIGRIIYFVAVAITFSWAQWFAVIASQQGWLAAHVSLGPLAIFGPLIAAFVASENRKRWLRSIFQWRIRPVVGLAATLLAPLIFVGCLAFATALTPGAPHVQFPSVRTIAVVSAGMFLTAGVGEEPGWRGFLLPELRKSVGPLVASFVVAVIWFVWHVPLFWVVGATQQQLPAFSFAIGILSYSFILTWLVEVSSNSTLPAMLFHASANVSFWFAMAFVKNLPQYSLLSRAYVVALASFGAAAAVLLVLRERKMARLRPMPAG
jgi:membrane protease YdiL (CAAX protease family)